MKLMAKTPDGEYKELKDFSEWEVITIDEQAFPNVSFDWGRHFVCKEPIRTNEIGHIDGLCTHDFSEMIAEQVKPENAVFFTYDKDLVSELYEKYVSVHDSTFIFIKEAIYRCCQKIASKFELGTKIRYNYKIDCTKERCGLPHDQRPCYSEYTVTVYYAVEK